MHGDFSKFPSRRIANAVGPLQQQGKVLLDTHLNDNTRIVTHWQDRAARAAFGARKLAVSSDSPNSFAVTEAEIAADASGTQQVFVTVTPGEAWADGLYVELAPDPL